MRQLWIVVAACSSSPNHAVPDAAPLADGAPDAPPDAAPLDPWTAPLGSALSGVTLSDGWTDLRALPAPMAIAGGWTDSLFATPDMMCGVAEDRAGSASYGNADYIALEPCVARRPM